MLRLYLDESGDHTYRAIDSLDRRYLALVGCFFEQNHYRENFQPSLEELKRQMFNNDPDDPVIFHRDDIINARGHFRILLENAVRAAFDTQLLDAITAAEFKIIGVVLDKKAHIERYEEAAWHPYHYCLTVMMERYCGLLHLTRQKGDVMAESRGGKEDMQLKEEFARVYREGVYHRSGSWFREVLTSHELKLKPKSKNVAGLQLADLIAHPVKQQILFERRHLQQITDNFGRRLCQALELKYNRQVYSGEVWGYGKKLLD